MSQEIPSYLSHMKVHLPYQTGSRCIVHLVSITVPKPRDKCVPVTTAWRVLRLRTEERPSVWRVAANILNKLSRTADTGWSSSLLTTPHRKNVYCYEIFIQ
jgi:hypothetical protein